MLAVMIAATPISMMRQRFLERVVPIFSSGIGRLPRAFWFLWVGTLITRLGSFIVPFLQIYLTRERGLTVETAGLLISLYGFGAIFANTVGGILADKIGRKATMILGLSLSATALLCLGFASTLPQLVGAMALFGLVNEIYRPASMAFISDVVKPEDRILAFNTLYWAFNLGAAIAPPIAGFFARDHFRLLFIADAATTIALLSIIAWKIKETRPEGPPSTTSGSALRGLAAPFADPVFLGFLAANVLNAAVFLQFLVAMPADMTAHGLSEAQFGAAVSLNGILIVLFQPFVGQGIKRGKRARLLALSSLLIGVGYGVYGFASEGFWVWIVGVVIWTAGEILMAPLNSSIVADLAPAHLRGRYNGAFAMSWSIAWIVAPALGGMGLQRLRSEGFWAAIFVIGVVTAVMQLLIAPARRRRMAALHGATATAD